MYSADVYFAASRCLYKYDWNRKKVSVCEEGGVRDRGVGEEGSKGRVKEVWRE